MRSHLKVKIRNILWFYRSVDLTTLTSSDDRTSTLHSDDWNACFVDAARTSQLPFIKWHKPLLHTFQVIGVVVMTTKWTLCVHAYIPAGTYRNPPSILRLCTIYNDHKLRLPDIYFAFRWSERKHRSRFKNTSIPVYRVTHGSTFIIFRSVRWLSSPPNSHSVCTIWHPNMQIGNRLLSPWTTYSDCKLRRPYIYVACKWIGHVKRRWRFKNSSIAFDVWHVSL